MNSHTQATKTLVFRKPTNDDVINDAKRFSRATHPSTSSSPTPFKPTSQRARDRSEHTRPIQNGVRDYRRQGDPRADARVDARATQTTEDAMRAREREQGA